jgi:hypothetical protein
MPAAEGALTSLPLGKTRYFFWLARPEEPGDSRDSSFPPSLPFVVAEAVGPP